MPTTEDLTNALAFAAAESHDGDVRVVLAQAKAACRTLAAVVASLPKCWRLNEANELVQDVPVMPELRVWLRVMPNDTPRKCRVRSVSRDSACVILGQPYADWAFTESLFASLESAEAVGDG